MEERIKEPGHCPEEAIPPGGVSTTPYLALRVLSTREPGEGGPVRHRLHVV